MNRIILILILSFATSLSYSQKLKKADRKIVESIQKNVVFLADDRLEGRRAGTDGEKAAYEYIIGQFKSAGIAPKGDNGSFLQAFEINDGKKIGSATFFKVNGKAMQTGKDYFPLTFSANAVIPETPVAISLSEKGAPWFKDIEIVLEENENNPHFDIYEYIRKEAGIAAQKGATALIIFNGEDKKDGIEFVPKDRSETSSIPVLYLTRNGKENYLKEAAALYEIELKVSLAEARRTGHNVVGYINNNAANTVIIGAHYDHLGYGEDGNSMVRDETRQIHNGADDNASGTAVLIELGKLLAKSRAKNNNYLLIAFSGEELGLLGSKYYTDHSTIDLSNANYMINLDMVGRLDDKNTVTVGGYGTSPLWSDVVHSQKKVPFTIKTDSSGTGPSDHTSFYRKNIPVLFFFTGTHSDYHKPSDDSDKINYTGALHITRYIVSLVEAVNRSGKLAFTPTREVQPGGRSSFSVTLGIMPDYSFSGTGVKADGVSDGRPAKKAGIKTGDIITKLGDYPVNSMQGYMQALGKFKKGDQTKVVVKRGEEELIFDIVF